MQTLLCDRCRKTIKPEDRCVVTMQHSKFTKLNSKPIELCAPCSKELELFFKGRKEGGRIW